MNATLNARAVSFWHKMIKIALLVFGSSLIGCRFLCRKHRLVITHVCSCRRKHRLLITHVCSCRRKYRLLRHKDSNAWRLASSSIVITMKGHLEKSLPSSPFTLSIVIISLSLSITSILIVGTARACWLFGEPLLLVRHPASTHIYVLSQPKKWLQLNVVGPTRLQVVRGHRW